MENTLYVITMDPEIKVLSIIADLSDGGIHQRELYKRSKLNIKLFLSCVENLINKNFIKEIKRGGYTFYFITDKGREALKKYKNDKEK